MSEELDGLSKEFNGLKEQYSKYALFYEGRRLTYSGLSQSFFYMLRRAVFIISALIMATDSRVIIAIAIFVVCSFFTLAYMIVLQPFQDKSLNRFEIINEFFVLLISYHTVVLLNDSFSR